MCVLWKKKPRACAEGGKGPAKRDERESIIRITCERFTTKFKMRGVLDGEGKERWRKVGTTNMHTFTRGGEKGKQDTCCQERGNLWKK